MANNNSSSTGQRGAIERHLAALPAEAPIRALAGAPDFERQLVDYEAANRDALRQQAKYKSLGHRALLLTTIATLMAALTLLPLDRWIAGPVRGAVSGLQSVANVLAMLLVWWIARRDYVSAWMQARADAERRRGALFESLLRAEAPVGADLKRLWREKLDLVTSAHIDYQLAYFTSATKKASDCDRKLSWPRKLSLLATVVVAVIGAAGVANYIRDQGIPMPGGLDQLTVWFRLADTVRWQLGLNTLATGLLAYASARALMNQDARNKALYEISAQRLTQLKDAELNATQAAADQGDGARVLAFFRDAQAILEADHLAWYLSRPPVDPRR